MFLTSRKGLVPNGKNPTYLYGYGGFNVPIVPGFSVADLVWMEHGGLIAYANLRGGGEYGGKSGIAPAPSCASRTSSMTSLAPPSG